MRRLSVLLAAALLLVGLAVLATSCGGGKGPPSESQENNWDEMSWDVGEWQ